MNRIEAYAQTTKQVGARSIKAYRAAACACAYAISGYAVPPAGFYARGWTDSIKAAARQLLDVSMRKYLRVFPIETQQIIWVRREDEVIYTVESNTHWNII